MAAFSDVFVSRTFASGELKEKSRAVLIIRLQHYRPNYFGPTFLEVGLDSIFPLKKSSNPFFSFSRQELLHSTFLGGLSKGWTRNNFPRDNLTLFSNANKFPSEKRAHKKFQIGTKVNSSFSDQSLALFVSVVRYW